MKRTWRDACCEVAWNYTQVSGRWFVNMRQFLKGEKSTIHHLNECNCITTRMYNSYIDSIVLTMNYDIFKQLFMQWLEENKPKNNTCK